MGTNSAPELLLELDRSGSLPLRAQLEDALRTAVREGRLGEHSRDVLGELGYDPGEIAVLVAAGTVRAEDPGAAQE